MACSKLSKCFKIYDRLALERLKGLLITSIGIFATSMTIAQPAIDGRNINLSEEEREWVIRNPTVKIAIDPNWKPIEFIENGHFYGLSSAYLQEVSRKTGLTFEIVAVATSDEATQLLQKNQVELLPSILKRVSSGKVCERLLFSRPFYVAMSVVVARDTENVVFDLKDLNGKTVAIKKGGAFEHTLRSMFPKIHIITTNTPEEALIEVLERRADAALGLDAVLLPYLRRKYSSILHLAGVIGSFPGDLVIGVRSDLPLLHSIINKSLASVNAKESDQLDASWLDGSDYGSPSLTVLLRYYRLEIILALSTLFIVAFLAYQAFVDRKKAIRSERSKARFLAVMSHEIRSPMHAVLGSIELLQGTELDNEQQRLSNLAVNGARTLLTLLDEVLDLSKLEAGQLTLNLAADSIDNIVSQALDLQQIHAKAKGISLIHKIETPMPRNLLIDSSRVTQIIHNLVSNAIKFTDQGTVLVKISFAPQAASSEHNEQASTGSLQLIVKDTGVGIALENQVNLFQPYSQANHSTNQIHGGTGLGLTICRELVTLMGGTITLESELNFGTTVTAQWPVSFLKTSTISSHADIKQVISPMPKSGDYVCNPYILLVEDSPLNAAVLKSQLSELSCTVVLAEDSQQALTLLDYSLFDMVLMDCDLPDRNGYKLTKMIRNNESDRKVKHTPIIAISASTGDDHARLCLSAGMDGVLNKPISLEKLREAVLIWCEDKTEMLKSQKSQPLISGSNLLRITGQDWYTEDLQGLNSALRDGKREAAIHFSHRLRGAALMLDEVELADTAKKLESNLRHNVNLDSIIIKHSHQKLVEIAHSLNSNT